MVKGKSSHTCCLRGNVAKRLTSIKFDERGRQRVLMPYFAGIVQVLKMSLIRREIFLFHTMALLITQINNFIYQGMKRLIRMKFLSLNF